MKDRHMKREKDGEGDKYKEYNGTGSSYDTMMHGGRGTAATAAAACLGETHGGWAFFSHFSILSYFDVAGGCLITFSIIASCWGFSSCSCSPLMSMGARKKETKRGMGRVDVGVGVDGWAQQMSLL
jgi:hypothetical protein